MKIKSNNYVNYFIILLLFLLFIGFIFCFAKLALHTKKISEQKKHLYNINHTFGSDFPGSNYRPSDRKNWISGLNPDKLRVNQIAWPGTHDSATNNIGIPLLTRPWFQCQTLSIYEQLKIGTRVLDIRVQEDKKLCHGVLVSYHVDVVINDVKKFLQETHSEIVILQFRTEFGHDDPPEFEKYLEEQFGEYLIHPDNGVFGKTISELLPKRIICIWKPNKMGESDLNGPLWGPNYLQDNWINTDLPYTKFASNMDYLSQQDLSTNRNYFYQVENTVTSRVDFPFLRWIASRIHPYARLFISQCFSKELGDRLQILSTDFIDEDFVDACVGLTSARVRESQYPLEISPHQS